MLPQRTFDLCVAHHAQHALGHSHRLLASPASVSPAAAALRFDGHTLDKVPTPVVTPSVLLDADATRDTGARCAVFVRGQPLVRRPARSSPRHPRTVAQWLSPADMHALRRELRASSSSSSSSSSPPPPPLSVFLGNDAESGHPRYAVSLELDHQRGGGGGGGGGGAGQSSSVPPTFSDEQLRAAVARVLGDDADADGSSVAFTNMRRAFWSLAPGDATLLGEAVSLLYWHRNSAHCAACGAPTAAAAHGRKRSCSNAHCFFSTAAPGNAGGGWFPRVEPVGIALVVRDGANEHAPPECLLGRKADWPAGRYSALAGFAEAGETIEDTVRREVREESGVRAGRVLYVASSFWPFPASLMIGCIAETERSARASSIVVDAHELEDARFVALPDVRRAIVAGHYDDSVRAASPPHASSASSASACASSSPPLSIPPPFAIAHQLMQRWIDANDPHNERWL